MTRRGLGANSALAFAGDLAMKLSTLVVVLVAVDPHTHRVYLPLENVDGKPVLRILETAGDS